MKRPQYSIAAFLQFSPRITRIYPRKVTVELLDLDYSDVNVYHYFNYVLIFPALSRKKDN